MKLREVEELGGKISALESELQKADAGTIFKKIREIISAFISRNRTETDKGSVAEIEAEIAKMQKERKELEGKFQSVKALEESLAKQYKDIQQEIEHDKDSSRDAEKAVFRIMAEQNEAHNVLNMIKNREEKILIEDENFKREIQEAAAIVGRAVLEFQKFMPVDAAGASLSPEAIVAEARGLQEERRKKIERIKIRLEDAGGAGGEDVMKEYKEASERDQFFERELADLDRTAQALKQLMEELSEKIDIEFKNGVHKINAQFQEFFALMFGGGRRRFPWSASRRKKEILPVSA